MSPLYGQSVEVTVATSQASALLLIKTGDELGQIK